MLDDARWGDDPRDRDSGSRDLNRGSRGGSDPRERERVEPRDVFVDRVSLPRGPDREHIRFRDRDYTLRGSESRTLASVGASASFLLTNFATPSTSPWTRATANSGISAIRDSSRRSASIATQPPSR